MILEYKFANEYSMNKSLILSNEKEEIYENFVFNNHDKKIIKYTKREGYEKIGDKEYPSSIYDMEVETDDGVSIENAVEITSYKGQKLIFRKTKTEMYMMLYDVNDQSEVHIEINYEINKKLIKKYKNNRLYSINEMQADGIGEVYRIEYFYNKNLLNNMTPISKTYTKYSLDDLDFKSEIYRESYVKEELPDRTSLEKTIRIFPNGNSQVIKIIHNDNRNRLITSIDHENNKITTIQYMDLKDAYIEHERVVSLVDIKCPILLNRYSLRYDNEWIEVITTAPEDFNEYGLYNHEIKLMKKDKSVYQFYWSGSIENLFDTNNHPQYTKIIYKNVFSNLEIKIPNPRNIRLDFLIYKYNEKSIEGRNCAISISDTQDIIEDLQKESEYSFYWNKLIDAIKEL